MRTAFFFWPFVGLLFLIFLSKGITQSISSSPSVSFAWSRYPTTGVSPPKRAFVSSDTDVQTANDGSVTSMRYILYGGGEGPIGVGKSFNDLWSFDLLTGLWGTLAATGDLMAPPRRGTVSGNLALLNNGMDLVLYGGGDVNTYYGDIIVYEMDTRYFRTLTTPFPRPAERKEHIMFPRNNKAVVFGGQSQSRYLPGLWEFSYDRTTGASSWLAANISGGSVTPPAMTQMQASYDSNRDRLLIWHGLYEEFNPRASDVDNFMWIYTWAQRGWSKVPMGLLNAQGTRISPFPARPGACSWNYDDKIYMFGGIDPDIDTLYNTIFMANLTASALGYGFADITSRFRLTNFATWVPRRNHDCQSFPSLPYLNRTNSGVLIFGGLTDTGVTNDLFWVDMVDYSITQLRANAEFPTPRTYHCTALIGITVYMFGGQDSAGKVLDDLWSARFEVSLDLSDMPTLSWSRENVLSARSPTSRIHSAAVNAIGMMWMFGGRDNDLVIQSELWTYQPTSQGWVLMDATSSTGVLPVARYAHTLDNVGGLLYMFGGFKATGQTLELWQLDPVLVVWTQIKAVFPGALWPQRRAFHSSGSFSIYVNQNALNIINNYIAGIIPTAMSLIASEPLSSFPPASRPDISARTEFNTTVVKTLQDVIQRLQPLTIETEINYLVVHGGISQEVGGGTVADIFIFDTVTRLWQVPGNFSTTSDVRRSGRHKHTLTFLGLVMMIQGGQDDVGLKPASPAYLPMIAAGAPGYSYPYTAWPRANKFIGDASDAFDGGVPPSPLALATSHFISMPPIIFTTSRAFTYVDGSSLSAFINGTSSTAMVRFPPGTSWSTVGMQSGHTSTKIADSIFYIGGFGRLSSSTTPVGLESAVNMRIIRARSDPTCTNIQTTTNPYFDGGRRQANTLIVGQPPCFLCSPGSHLAFFASGEAYCKLCPIGRYAPAFGSLSCLPCPRGFYRAQPGGVSLPTCLPCPIGFYQNQTGQDKCLPCPAGTNCSVASITPSNPINAVSTSFESQPGPLVVDPVVLVTMNFSTIGGGGLLLLIIIVVYIVNQRYDCFTFKRFDFLYSAKHPLQTRPKPKVPDSKMWKEFYITEWQTSIGGLFSLLCVIACTVVTLLLTLPYKYDNVTELQSLVPNLSIPPADRADIRSDMVITVDFHGYGDNCNVGENSSTVCHPKLSFRANSLSSKVYQGMACETIPNGCRTLWTCRNCALDDDGASLVISSTQGLAFAERLSWSVTAGSGRQAVGASHVPGGIISRLGDSIAPASGYVFRGNTPTLVSLRATYSVYKADSAIAQSGSGFLIQFSSQTVGSNVPDSLFPLVNGIGFMVNFTRADTTFLVKHDLKLSAQQTAAALAGALSAVMGAFASVMMQLENFLYDRNKKNNQNDADGEKADASEGDNQSSFKVSRRRHRRTSSAGLPGPSHNNSDDESAANTANTAPGVSMSDFDPPTPPHRATDANGVSIELVSMEEKPPLPPLSSVLPSLRSGALPGKLPPPQPPFGPSKLTPRGSPSPTLHCSLYASQSRTQSLPATVSTQAVATKPLQQRLQSLMQSGRTIISPSQSASIANMPASDAAPVSGMSSSISYAITPRSRAFTSSSSFAPSASSPRINIIAPHPTAAGNANAASDNPSGLLSVTTTPRRLTPTTSPIPTAVASANPHESSSVITPRYSQFRPH